MDVNAKGLDTGYLQAKDQEHFLHPWQEFDASPERLVISRAQGARVYDSDGKEYIDGIGGMWCVNAGYGRQEIADVMAEQAATMPYYSTFTDTTNAPAVQLAEKLAELGTGIAQSGDVLMQWICRKRLGSAPRTLLPEPPRHAREETHPVPAVGVSRQYLSRYITDRP